MINELIKHIDEELVEELVYFKKDVLLQLGLNNENSEYISQFGIPRSVSIDIDFLPERRGGGNVLSNVYSLNSRNQFINNINNLVLIAEHNNGIVAVDPITLVVSWIDMECEQIIYANKDLSAFLDCVVILNKFVHELCTKNPDAYLDELLTDEILSEIEQEFKSMDSSIDCEDSFWYMVFEEIRDMR